jgi:hypothetical protein
VPLLRWRPKHPVTACRMSRSRCRRAGTSRPALAFGTGSGSVSAVVVASASMSERAVFIGSISVWDTIGTLGTTSIEISKLFPPPLSRDTARARG